MIEHVAVSCHDDVVVATVSGEIDISNVAAVGATIAEALSHDALGLVVDLGSVSYIDSAGIRMLFELARRTETTRQSLGIALDDSSPVRRLLKITNIQEVVALCGTVDECAAAMREASI